MKQSIISEQSARFSIAVLFAATLLGFFMFWWSASSYSALQPLAAEIATLPGQLQLLEQVDQLEQQLTDARETANKAQQQAQQAKEQSRIAQIEADRLTNTKVEILENLFLEYKGEFYATSYCCERYPHICGGNGVTASGTVPTPGLTIAADWSVLPSGTWVYIEGVGMRRVEDTGSAIKGKRIDVAINTHANALRWKGQGRHHVWVLNLE